MTEPKKRRAPRSPYRHWLNEVLPTGAPFTAAGASDLIQEAGFIDKPDLKRLRAAIINHPDIVKIEAGLYQYTPSDGTTRVLRAPSMQPSSNGHLTVRQVGHDLKGRALLRGSDGALYMAVPWT